MPLSVSRSVRRLTLGAALVLAAGLPPASAQEAPTSLLPSDAGTPSAPPAASDAREDLGPISVLPRLDQQRRAFLAHAEGYLNGIRTAQARFLQISSTGNYAEGMLYIKRPNRMRLQYDPPADLLMVANGSHLVYYDRELDQVSYIDLDDTPLGVLLQENIRFDDPSITITDVREAAGVVEIALVQTKDPGQGALTLVFNKDPIELRQWRVLDNQNIEVAVSLFNIRQGVDMNRRLFIFDESEERPDR